MSGIDATDTKLRSEILNSYRDFCLQLYISRFFEVSSFAKDAEIPAHQSTAVMSWTVGIVTVCTVVPLPGIVLMPTVIRIIVRMTLGIMMAVGTVVETMLWIVVMRSVILAMISTVETEVIVSVGRITIRGVAV